MINYGPDGASPDLLRLQRVHKRLLAKLAVRCDELGLQWFLVAGSALGSIRHGDVIPWDDDIDVGLVRDDYERLCADLAIRPIPGTTLQSWATDPEYALAFANLRLDGSFYSEDHVNETGVHRGIYIDLFPFDRLPRSAMTAALQRSLLGLLNLVIMPAYYDAVTNDRSAIRNGMRVLALWLRPLFRKETLYRTRESLSRLKSSAKGDWADCFGMFGVGYHKRTKVRLSELVPPSTGKFGELNVPLPAQPDAYLRRMYGDYMALPPESEREPKHGMRVCFPEGD